MATIISPALILKIVGGGAALSPAVGGTTYAVLTTQKYEGMKKEIRVLREEVKTTKTKLGETERSSSEKDETITELRKVPDAAEKEALKQRAEKAEADLAKTKKDLESSEEVKSSHYNKWIVSEAKVKGLEQKVDTLTYNNKAQEMALKTYRTKIIDPHGNMRVIIKAVVKNLRDAGFHSGYNNYALFAGSSSYGKPYGPYLCKGQDGGITVRETNTCQKPEKSLTIKEAENWANNN